MQITMSISCSSLFYKMPRRSSGRAAPAPARAAPAPSRYAAPPAPAPVRYKLFHQ